jgi:putative ABC transport system permease protein
MFRFLDNLLHRNRKEQDLSDEVEACLGLLAEEGMSTGMSYEEARRSAYQRFGGPDQVKDAVRDVRAGEALRRCWQDLSYARRTLWKSPGFAVAAISILTVGIGANTAMFSIVGAVLLKSLPYRHPDQLVRIRQSLPEMSETQLGTAPPEFASYRDRSRVFSSVAGYQDASFDVTGLREPEHVPACRITASLFDTLAVHPFIGRAFTRRDEAPHAERVVLISYAYWVRQYGADPAVLTKTIELDEQPYRIVGVMPRGFLFPLGELSPGAPPALWLPLSFSPDDLKDWASSFDTSVIARLKPGATLAQAQDDVSRVARLFQQENPAVYSGNTLIEASVVPWNPDLNTRLPAMLRILSLAVGVVLLISCANVGNLLLARMAERQREISIRRALGASSWRLARQIFTETALLAVAAAVFGCGLAMVFIRGVAIFWSADLNFRRISVDSRVLLVTVLVSWVTCGLCAALPALAGRKPDIHAVLRQSGQPSGAPGTRRLSKLLLCAEVAASMVLLVAAALLFASFRHVLSVPLGFNPENALIVRTNFNAKHYPSHEKRREVEREILARLAALPQVQATALTTHVPLADERQIGFEVEGAPERDAHWADNAIVSGDYFSTMGTRILRGRTFSDRDNPHSPAVALMNETMARRYWPHADPAGKAFRWAGRRFQVIGVVEDLHSTAIDQPVGPMVYFDAYQMENHVLASGVFLIRTAPTANLANISAQARRAIWSVDPAIPILGIGTLHEVVSSSLATRRASLLLAFGFAAIACLLAIFGIYSVASQSVSQRVREIGIRLALGAQPREIQADILAAGLRLLLWGALAGGLLSVLSARLLSSILFGVSASDSAPYIASAAVMMAAAVAGLYAPARRASRVDPLIAMRAE